MCVLAFAWCRDDRWPIVLIGNRDERHARPAAPLGRWEDSPILAGRDLESGGTWLGVSEEGRLAVVTNVATGAPAARRSRGAIVANFLRADFLGTGDPIGGDRHLEDYNPFNLIAFDRRSAKFVSNQPRAVHRRLSPGLHALANGGLDERLPRTDNLKAALAEWLAGDRDRPEALLAALGVGRAAGDCVPVFIRDPVYGTRCSTVAAIDAGGRGLIVERRFHPDGSVSGETKLDFQWPSNPVPPV